MVGVAGHHPRWIQTLQAFFWILQLFTQFSTKTNKIMMALLIWALVSCNLKLIIPLATVCLHPLFHILSSVSSKFNHFFHFSVSLFVKVLFLFHHVCSSTTMELSLANSVAQKQKNWFYNQSTQSRLTIIVYSSVSLWTVMSSAHCATNTSCLWIIHLDQEQQCYPRIDKLDKYSEIICWQVVIFPWVRKW